MKAAILNALGQPFTIESLPTPEPRAGEVLLKIRACGVCHTDLHVIKGEVPFPLPCVLGHEVSGHIAALGPGVAGLSVGQAVVGAFIMPCGTCAFCARGMENLCETFFAYNRLQGKLYDGDTRLRRPDGSPVWMYSMAGLAEYAVIPATAVCPLPDGVPLEEAAILGCAVFTAYGAVRNAADLRVGEAVAVVAVGGVGSSLIQIARAAGAAPIIAVDISAEKLAAARSLGADYTIDATREPVTQRIQELTGGRGVDVAFEALGHPQTFAQAIDAVRPGGRAVIVGIAPTQARGEVELARLVRRGVQIIGSYGARPRVDLPSILGLVQRGDLDLRRMVSRRFGLDDAQAAYDTLAGWGIVGRAIVVMEERTAER
jgi:S-(hydroxymethyl)glutathione dehydrogenase/alcohol dehydrogenase